MHKKTAATQLDRIRATLKRVLSVTQIQSFDIFTEIKGSYFAVLNH